MTTPTFGARLRLAFAVLGDPLLAQRVLELQTPAAPAALPEKPTVAPAPEGPGYDDGALGLLALLQREGRLVDFLMDEVAAASDADVAAAARVVHEGCRAALKRHVPLVPLWDKDEGAQSEVPADYDPSAVKLTGAVSGKGPWKGTVRHRGWRAEKTSLPQPTKGHDATAIAPAEIEIG